MTTMAVMSQNNCLNKLAAALKGRGSLRFIHTSRLLFNSSSAVDLSYSTYDPVEYGGAGGQRLVTSPLFITHGLLGSKANWHSIAKAVSKATNRKIITFDARNHGDSPKTLDHSYELMAEDVLTLAQNLMIDKFSLMGHSMGGRMAMVVALKYPNVLDKLVVVDVSPISLQSQFHSEMKDYIKTMAGINFDVGRKMVLSEARKIGNDALVSLVPSAAIRAFLLTNLADSGGRVFWKPNLSTLLKAVETIGDFPEDLIRKKFADSTLFIRGQKSPYIPDADWPDILKLFPSATLTTIPDTGHWPHSEKSKLFLDCLIPFLNS